VCFTRLFKTLLPTAQLAQEAERPAVNHEVMGSSLHYDFFSYHFFPSLFKVPSTVGLYAAYSVKQYLLQSFSTYSFNITLVVGMCYPMNIYELARASQSLQARSEIGYVL